VFVARPPMDTMETTAPLTSFSDGTDLQLVFFSLDTAEAQRLREMGLYEGARISIIKNTNKVIVRVDGSRIGLRRELAMHLFGTRASAA